MSATVKGKSKDEAEKLFDTFHRLVTGDMSGLSAADLGRLAAFSGVSEFPARVKCATLAWHTLHTALEGKEQTVSTE
jgi:nitrogen fixation NifU-like protein